MTGFWSRVNYFLPVPARSCPPVPDGQTARAEPAEEHTPPHCQPTVPYREAGLVPGRLRATLGRRPEEGHGGMALSFYRVNKVTSREGMIKLRSEKIFASWGLSL